MLAQTALLEHTYREDSFAINGTFTYELREPAERDYIDTISNGTYTSRQGRIEWTSPKDGEGYFEGTALGDGRDTVNVGGRRACSEYGIEDIGSFDLTIDAVAKSMKIDQTDSISSRYTYYRDLTGGFCPQPNPPWSRFFGGRSNLYVGSFDAQDHTASIRYDGSSPDLNVDSPKAKVRWTSNAATDFELQAVPHYPDPVIPNGWDLVDQTTERPDDLKFIDVKDGGVEITVKVTGKPWETASVTDVVGRLRLFWANSAGDVSGAEIPVQSLGGPVGVYWNSAELRTIIDDFPEPPTGATHVRIAIEGVSAPDANASNNFTFLEIETFEARNSATGPLSEDGVLDGTGASVLNLSDSLNPSIRVLAYKPVSSLGALVFVTDDEGSFFYDPFDAPLIQRLAPGETVNDGIDFRAIKHQTLVDDAVHIVTLEGRNDLPTAEDDEFATTNLHSINFTPAELLANDTDIDNGDSPSFVHIDAESMFGAALRVTLNANRTAVAQITYDPVASETLRQLAKDEQVVDQVDYQIVDRHGGSEFGTVLITVTGETARLFLRPIPLQLTVRDTPTTPIPLQLEDPDGDPSDLVLSAVASHGALIPAQGFEFISEGAGRSLVITPAAGMTGRSTITVTAAGPSTSVSTEFQLIVGTTTDADLDGVDNAEEDAAPNGGDMNLDGQPDSSQPHVASLRTQQGNAYVNLAIAEGSFLENVLVGTLPNGTGPATGASFPLGSVHYEFDVPTGSALHWIAFRTDYAEPINRYFQEGASGVFDVLMHNKSDGARVYADRIELMLRAGGRADLDGADGDRVSGTAALAQVDRPWRNIVREDIDNDGNVVPLDVLLLINQINSRGSRNLGMRPSGSDTLPFFLDPNGNNSLEPLDVLVVINFLNARSGEAEGEPGSGSAKVGILPLTLPSPPTTSHVTRARPGATREILNLASPAHSGSASTETPQRDVWTSWTHEADVDDWFAEDSFASDLFAELALGEKA